MPRSRAQRNYGPSAETKAKVKGSYTRSLKIVTLLIFLGTLTALVVWTIPQFYTFVSTGIGTTVRISTRDNVDFPSVTICNLVSNVTLRFQACTNPDGSKCFGARRDDTGDLQCTTFNYDWRNPLQTTKPGLLSLLTMQFSISKSEYPAGSGLFGAQVILHEPGTRPETEKQALFVSPGQATILTLRRTQTNHLPPPRSSGGVTVGWDSSPSLLAIDGGIRNADEIIVVGLMYRELNVLEIDEIVLYPLGQFMGNFAGMIGTLLGLDVLNCAIMLVTALFAFLAGRKAAKKKQQQQQALQGGGGATDPQLTPLHPYPFPYYDDDGNVVHDERGVHDGDEDAAPLGVVSSRHQPRPAGVTSLRLGALGRGAANDDDGGMHSPRGGRRPGDFDPVRAPHSNKTANNWSREEGSWASYEEQPWGDGVPRKGGRAHRGDMSASESSSVELERHGHGRRRGGSDDESAQSIWSMFSGTGASSARRGGDARRSGRRAGGGGGTEEDDTEQTAQSLWSVFGLK